MKPITVDTTVGELKPCKLTANCPYGEVRGDKFYTPCESCPKPVGGVMNPDEAYAKAMLLVFVVFPITAGVLGGLLWATLWVINALNLPDWVYIFFFI